MIIPLQNPYPSNGVTSPSSFNSIDRETGLLTRLEFLDRAGGEFRRAKRYGRELSVCIVDPVRENLSETNFAALAMLVMEGSRSGIDIGGRMGDRLICVLLPETTLGGAQDFAARTHRNIERNQVVMIPDFTTRQATCLTEDTGIMQVLARVI